VIASAAKQSRVAGGILDCFAALAMTECGQTARFNLTCHHPRRRTIQYAAAVVTEPRSRDVLDTRLRGHDGLVQRGGVPFP
ncbi:hypothetical protein, partial [Bradyrhizobium sp.]|uniref:hypothetical protein n=1 Tax=Bradyrhizobium sp. TaxID=376 RepID=UPI00391A8EF6